MTEDQLFGEKDIEKENEVLKEENRKLRLVLYAYEELMQKYWIDLKNVKTKVMIDEKSK